MLSCTLRHERYSLTCGSKAMSAVALLDAEVVDRPVKGDAVERLSRLRHAQLRVPPPPTGTTDEDVAHAKTAGRGVAVRLRALERGNVFQRQQLGLDDLKVDEQRRDGRIFISS